MLRDPYPLVRAFLSLNHTFCSARRLNLLLRSHPDYLSFNNITDAFDELDIQYISAMVETAQLPNIQSPCITTLTLNSQDQFLIIKKVADGHVHLIMENLTEFTIPQDIFFQIPRLPLIIIGEEPAYTQGKKAGYFLKTTRRPMGLGFAVIIVLMALSRQSSAGFIFDALSLSGVLVTWLIFLKENNIYSLADRICGESHRFSCAAVFASKGSRLPLGIKVSDLSMVYFAGLLILGLTDNSRVIGVRRVCSAASLLAIPFSIFYQWRVIKKWCPLCLSVVGILLCQFLLLYLSPAMFVSTSIAISTLVIVFPFTILLWIGIRQLVLGQKEGYEDRAVAMRFTRDYHLFLQHFASIPEEKMPSIQSPVSFGTPNARIHLIALLNVQCEPCAKMYAVLHKLSLSFPGDVLVNLVFYCNPEEGRSKRVEIITQLLAGCRQKSDPETRQILDRWYREGKVEVSPDIDKFENETQSALQQFWEFRKINELHTAPMLLLNGKRFPDVYPPQSLQFLMPYLLEKLDATKPGYSSFLLQQDSPVRNSAPLTATETI